VGAHVSSSSGPVSTQKRSEREVQLILCCAAAAFNAERRNQLGIIIESSVNWEVVMSAAPRQGVMQSVYRALVPAFASHLPPPVRDRMRREVQGNAVRNCHLAAEAVRLCRLLEKHGVRALVLKGPALAADVYGDVTLRQFNDLDLLVRQADLGVAVSALAADGFHTKARLNQMRGLLSSWEVTLVHGRCLFELDLHWRLSPPYFPFTPEGDQLWCRAVEVDLGVGHVSTLCPEDLVLFLCAHGAKHGWQSLSGVCDVAQAVRAHHYDWDRLLARSKSMGSLRIVLLGMLLAHDFLGAAIPEALIDAARAEPAVVRGARTFRRYFDQLEANGPGLHQRWSIPLSMIGQRSARFRYTFARVFLPACKDFDFVTLPHSLFPLYYIARPLRLALQKSRIQSEMPSVLPPGAKASERVKRQRPECHPRLPTRNPQDSAKIDLAKAARVGWECDAAPLHCGQESSNRRS